jgi:hypothetical protein
MLVVPGRLPLRRDLPRECLGYDLSVLHHERVTREVKAVIRCLGLLNNVGGVALDVLPEHLKVHTRPCDLSKQQYEESLNRGRTKYDANRREELRVGGVARHHARDVAVADAA